MRGEDEKWVDTLEKHRATVHLEEGLGTIIKTDASLWAGKLTLRAVCSYTHPTVMLARQLHDTQSSFTGTVE